MGRELRLHPLQALYPNPNGTPGGYSHTMLDIGKNYELFSAIASRLSPRPLRTGHDISGHLAFYNERTCVREYGTFNVDAYGDPYTYVTAGVLAPLLAEFFCWPGSAFGRAAAAYVATLPADTWIILDWH